MCTKKELSAFQVVPRGGRGVCYELSKAWNGYEVVFVVRWSLLPLSDSHTHTRTYIHTLRTKEMSSFGGHFPVHLRWLTLWTEISFGLAESQLIIRTTTPKSSSSSNSNSSLAKVSDNNENYINARLQNKTWLIPTKKTCEERTARTSRRMLFSYWRHKHSNDMKKVDLTPIKQHVSQPAEVWPTLGKQSREK